MIKNQLPKILMVSTEYPPMRGGVGRYTSSKTATEKGIECSCC